MTFTFTFKFLEEHVSMGHRLMKIQLETFPDLCSLGLLSQQNGWPMKLSERGGWDSGRSVWS